MKLAPIPVVPLAKIVLVFFAASFAGGCLGVPDVDAETGPTTAAAASNPERAAALADMRRRSRAADEQPFPDVFFTEQTTRLAARQEPRTVADLDTVEAELAAIAALRSAAVTPEETAALDARAAELQQLAASIRGGGAAQ